MIRRVVEALFWHYQEKDNWEMKMNEPIAIRKVTGAEREELLKKAKKNHAN